jgi:hypothetical protein
MASAARNLFIVEGTDDRYFLNRILLHHGYEKSSQADRDHFIVNKEGRPEQAAIEIVPCNGFDNIPNALKASYDPMPSMALPSSPTCTGIPIDEGALFGEPLKRTATSNSRLLCRRKDWFTRDVTPRMNSLGDATPQDGTTNGVRHRYEARIASRRPWRSDRIEPQPP